MMRSPKEPEPLLNRMRRFSRGIVLATVLTLAALLFLAAALLGEPYSSVSTDQKSRPLAEPSASYRHRSLPIEETGSVTPTSAPGG